MTTPNAAAAPAADAHAAHADHGKEPWYKNGFAKAGIIFCTIIAFGFGLGVIAPEVNNFIIYVMGAFFATITNWKTAIFVLLAAAAMAKWIFS